MWPFTSSSSSSSTPAAASTQTPGTSVTNGCAICKHTAPCDVAELTIQTSPARKLTTTKVLRSKESSTPLKIAHWDDQDRQTYDLIIDTLADYDSAAGNAAAAKTANIDGFVKWDPACSNGLVHVVELSQLHDLGKVDAPSSPEPGLPKKDHEHVSIEHVQGPSIGFIDQQGADAEKAKKDIKKDGYSQPQIIAVLFGIFAEAYQMHDAKRFAIVADSCGVRPGGASPNGSLRGLVQVFRKLGVTLKFEYPAGRARTGEKGTIGVTRSVTNDDGTTTKSTSIVNSRQVMDATPTSRDITAVQTDRAAGTTHIFGNADTPSVTQGVTLTINVNGRQLDTSALVRLLAGVKKIEDLLAGFSDFVSKAPQVGWKLKYSVQVISGSLELGLERKESSTVVENRVLPLDQYLTINLNLRLLKVELDLSFGILVGEQLGDREGADRCHHHGRGRRLGEPQLANRRGRHGEGRRHAHRGGIRTGRARRHHGREHLSPGIREDGHHRHAHDLRQEQRRLRPELEAQAERRHGASHRVLRGHVGDAIRQALVGADALGRDMGREGLVHAGCPICPHSARSSADACGLRSQLHLAVRLIIRETRHATDRGPLHRDARHEVSRRGMVQWVARRRRRRTGADSSVGAGAPPRRRG